MARDFLAYWEPETVDAASDGNGHDNHAANNQFRRMKVSEGDSVWFVTVRAGRLKLITRIVVGHITNQRGAARLLGARPSDLYPAKDHIIAASGTAPVVHEQDIHTLASRLRFESSSGNDRLKLVSRNAVNPQQLQTMRILTPASARLLGRIIKDGDTGPASDSLTRRAGNPGGGFGQTEQNARVEKAAVRVVRDWYEHRGWKVESVENQGCGFDLLCTRSGKELHVEVKGVSGDAEQFIATAGEVRRIKRDPQFILAFVPNALSQAPAIEFWSGKHLRTKFRCEPIQFRLTKKC